ncbi:hypothetical protein ETH_00009320 [Eimeria tenella]|uniref:Uncharacterized protein n=1 Tax=Eimeria tenella TaxID=5802 RepID=U6L7T2_EIMTE|nr:hypothetical protein ETH_00009320 [Eimeria tenella]CDJ45273.1 hypothetical protein ETH_00009320 [Eimeria tenella]|eukprot:XP_013236020.1 hypothetical protein ETH_00009320 [Eimeria tenella]
MTEALAKAVLRGDADAVKRLLEEGADPSALNKKGNSRSQQQLQQGGAGERGSGDRDTPSTAAENASSLP